jgi:hypothetical protein
MGANGRSARRLVKTSELTYFNRTHVTFPTFPDQVEAQKRLTGQRRGTALNTPGIMINYGVS